MGEAQLKKTCEHNALDIDCQAVRLNGTDMFMATVAARCRRCHKRFVFVGDWGETPSVEAPSIAQDGRLVLLPMRADAAPTIIGVN